MTIGLEKTRELRRAYYAAVSFVDSELGRVISEVATILVMTHDGGGHDDGGHDDGGHDDGGHNDGEDVP